MMYDIRTTDGRKDLIKALREGSNKRDLDSMRDYDIFSGRLTKHVSKYLLDKYKPSTVKEMTLIDSINMAKRVAKQEAAIYKDSPIRSFEGATPETSQGLKDLYELISLDTRLLKANQLFRHVNQVFLYFAIDTRKKKIDTRILKKHNLKFYDHPDFGEIYLISNFKHVTSKMSDDEKLNAERWTLWSADFNLVCNGNGESQDENIDNPYGGMIPIVEISTDKDEDFWINEETGLSNFTIQFNAALSDLLHVMRMQGFAIGTISGHADVLEKLSTATIGLNSMLLLPKYVTSKGGEVKEYDTTASYISPNPDLQGSIDTISTLLSAFLTARGVDPNTVSLSGSSEKYGSGWERLLALISKFDSSKEDIPIFKKVEGQILEIIKKIVSTYKNSPEVLSEDFRAIPGVLENAFVSVEYKKPEMIETKADLLARLKAEIAEGFRTVKSAIMEYFEVSEERALEIMEEVRAEKLESPEVTQLIEGENEQ